MNDKPRTKFRTIMEMRNIQAINTVDCDLARGKPHDLMTNIRTSFRRYYQDLFTVIYSESMLFD
jgi:hypothetical protein